MNALSFSVNVRSNRWLRFVNASLGSGATGAAFDPKHIQAASGQLGFLVGLEPPGTFAAGTQVVVNLNFASVKDPLDGPGRSRAGGMFLTDRRPGL
jgi:hypothetical protein